MVLEQIDLTGESRVLSIALGDERILPGNRPIDSDIRVIPGNTTVMFGTIEIRYLVLYLSVVFERAIAMREARRDP
jgi:hypothetical protein